MAHRVEAKLLSSTADRHGSNPGVDRNIAVHGTLVLVDDDLGGRVARDHIAHFEGLAAAQQVLANTLVKPGKSGVRGLLVLLLVCADKEVEVLDAVGGRGGVFLEKRDLEKGLPLQKPITK